MSCGSINIHMIYINLLFVFTMFKVKSRPLNLMFIFFFIFNAPIFI